MRQFQKLRKGYVYHFKIGKQKRIRRGIYQRRFFNKQIRQWVYYFIGLEIGHSYTPIANETKIILDSGWKYKARGGE